MNVSTQDFRYVVSCGTDVGRVRSLNEDALLDRGDIGLWVVADGMGGHAAGDFASQAIVAALGQVAAPSDGSSFLREVEERIQDTHAALRQESVARGSGGIIGSTVVALLAWDRHYACVWAGDSRLYLLRDGDLHRVSRDHSLVQDLVDAGELAPDQAETHPQSNVVTRAVGAVEDLVLDKTHEQISTGDTFLLCSDGLTRHVSDQEIAAVLAGETAPGAAQVLIDMALERGAKDNVTTIVVRCELEDGASGDPGGGLGGDPGGGLGGDPGGGLGTAHLPEAWDADSETTMPLRAPFHATGGATDAGPEPAPRVLDPAPGTASEDPLASILADGPADRVAAAGRGVDAGGMAEDSALGRGLDPLDLAEDSDPLFAADPPCGPGAARAAAASGGAASAKRLGGPLSGRGIRVGLLLCAGVVALAVAAYVLYSILTLS